MKIAFLNIYNGLVERGAETFVSQLAKRLAKRNKVVVYQAGDLSGHEGYEVRTIDLKLKPIYGQNLSGLRRKFFTDYWSLKVLLFSLKAIRDIGKEKYDIVVPINGGWQSLLVRLVTFFYGGKMVISGQSGIGWDDIVNLWSFPDIFIALSSYGRNWASSMNQFVKVKLIPNGVDLNQFKIEGDKYKHSLETPVVVCVAALSKNKRINLLIDAVEKLRNVSLLVCGKGELKDDIEKYGKKSLGERFKLISLSHDDVAKVYRSGDIFSLPSESFQSFEIVLVEAMACGKGIVANNDPIRREIVNEAGLFVDPENVNQYAKALTRAIKIDWKSISRNQAKKFDWDEISQMYEKVFEDLLD